MGDPEGNAYVTVEAAEAYYERTEAEYAVQGLGREQLTALALVGAVGKFEAEGLMRKTGCTHSELLWLINEDYLEATDEIGPGGHRVYLAGLKHSGIKAVAAAYLLGMRLTPQP